MIKTRIPALAVLLWLAAGTGFAQNGDRAEALYDLVENGRLDPNLFDRTLQLDIMVTVLQSDERPAWNVKSSKVTIPGRSIAIKLLGENLRVEVVFTPYQRENGIWDLVAQGQVWYSEAPQKATRYLTTLESIPVSMGEKVLFFPLGFSEQQTFTLQLEVEIFPFRDLLDQYASKRSSNKANSSHSN